MSRELTDCQRIERSILTTYREKLWTPFTRAVRQYGLIEPGDRIGVCISGGKDSMLMAKLFQELLRHTRVPFEAVYLVMDPGYNAENRRRIEANAARLEVPVTIFESDIFQVANHTEKNPCYLCARMRRGHLYSQARDLGCNKIALGHHFNDVIETTLLGMFYGAQLQAMPPKLRSKNFPGMELIRPLYMVHEDAIIAWAKANDLRFIQCACRFTENAAREEGSSKRQEIKLLLKRLRRDNPDIETNVFNSIHAVWLNTMPGWKANGRTYGFEEIYRASGTDGGEGEK